MKSFPYKKIFLTSCVIPILASCTPKEHQHGNMIQDYQVERISSGKHTKQSVLKILGSPTTKAPFDENRWYYIGQKSESYGIVRPEIVEQKVILVEFDESGRVISAENVNTETLNDLPIVASETPTAGTDESAIRRFFGNLGRFNQPGVGAGTSGDVGGPGAPGPGR